MQIARKPCQRRWNQAGARGLKRIRKKLPAFDEDKNCPAPLAGHLIMIETRSPAEAGSSLDKEPPPMKGSASRLRALGRDEKAAL